MVWLPLIGAIISLLADLGARSFQDKTRFRWFIPSGVFTWAGIEMIRLFLPIAGTWAFIAYPLYRQVWLIQPVSIFGIIGQGMLVMLVNHSLALGFMYWMDKHWQFDKSNPISKKIWQKWERITLYTTAGWLLLSLAMLLVPYETSSVNAAAIQPSLSPIQNANQGKDAIVTQLHARMLEQTREAAGQGAEFIVWPEGGLNWDPQVEDRLNLVDLATQTAVHLAVGYVLEIDQASFRNEATVINPQGKFLGVFGKDHPVVFGGETSPTRGTYPVYKTPLGVLGTIICYDLDYTDTARKLARQGAQLVGVPSNDWGTIADKHYTHVVFRAVENRLAMVKADGGFDSVIVDPFGRIKTLAAYPQGGEATLVANITLGNGKGTIYTLLGDWIGWLALAGMAFFMFGGKWLKKRAGE